MWTCCLLHCCLCADSEWVTLCPHTVREDACFPVAPQFLGCNMLDDSHNQILWGSFFWNRSQRLGTLRWARCLALQRFLPGLWYPSHCWMPLCCLLIHLNVAFLHILSCRGAVLEVCMLFSEIVALYLVVVLVCWWRWAKNFPVLLSSPHLLPLTPLYIFKITSE